MSEEKDFDEVLGAALGRAIVRYPKSTIWMVAWMLLGAGAGGWAGLAIGTGIGGVLLVLGHIAE